ncbi:hypothetical protein JMJ76_0007543, partial [Colletotrichum scovillei]
SGVTRARRFKSYGGATLGGSDLDGIAVAGRLPARVLRHTTAIQDRWLVVRLDV